ncbi:MAG: hypothetical protein MUQ20_01895, partial [Deltaproteobacteria bacterium]|nr:hypothetical protein [Deltaproteobacteria bacterium]
GGRLYIIHVESTRPLNRSQHRWSTLHRFTIQRREADVGKRRLLNELTIHGANIDRIKNNKIVEHWGMGNGDAGKFLGF